MKIALCQMTSSDAPEDNAVAAADAARKAASAGANLVCTPEVTNCVSQSRTHQTDVLVDEAEDATLLALSKVALDAGIWVAIGSLALKTDDPNGRFANRSILVGPDGQIAARYDKMHMFDVNVTETESFRESEGFRPGATAVVAQTPIARIGLTVCYDIRFPHLHRTLAKNGADIILVPAAFSPVTGQAHWEPLLRARAIETGCFVIATAQTGAHPVSRGRPRGTYGHSMVVSPWGEVLLDAGTAPGLHMVDIDLGEVADARRRIPALTHDVAFEGP